MRGLRHLDRENNSSHVLEVEAYNSEQGSMRSSVRVRTSLRLRWRGAAEPVRSYVRVRLALGECGGSAELMKSSCLGLE